MKVTIYSKEGCQYCDHARDLCESEGLDHEKVMIEKEELKELCGGSVTTYPQIFIDGRRIGTYFAFQDYIEDEYEPLLAPTLNRFTVFPLTYAHLWELYTKAQMSNWTAEEVDLSKDIEDWKTLNDNKWWPPAGTRCRVWRPATTKKNTNTVGRSPLFIWTTSTNHFACTELKNVTFGLT